MGSGQANMGGPNPQGQWGNLGNSATPSGDFINQRGFGNPGGKGGQRPMTPGGKGGQGLGPPMSQIQPYSAPSPPTPWDPTGQSVFGSGQPAPQPQNYVGSEEQYRDILNGTPRRGVPPQPAPWDPTGQNVFGSGQPAPQPQNYANSPERMADFLNGTPRWGYNQPQADHAYNQLQADHAYNQFQADRAYNRFTQPPTSNLHNVGALGQQALGMRRNRVDNFNPAKIGPRHMVARQMAARGGRQGLGSLMGRV